MSYGFTICYAVFLSLEIVNKIITILLYFALVSRGGLLFVCLFCLLVCSFLFVCLLFVCFVLFCFVFGQIASI